MKGEEDKDRKDLEERNVSNGKIILKEEKDEVERIKRKECYERRRRKGQKGFIGKKI